MKKVILFVIMAIACFVSVFAADAVPVIEPGIFDTIYQLFVKYVNPTTVAIVATVCFILSEIIPYIKWIPQNSVLAMVWSFIKDLILLFARKRK